MKKSILFALVMVCALLVLLPAEAEGGLDIVTTAFPEYDFARAVVGDGSDITMLIRPGSESHSYEPTPMDIIKIQSCDVFICAGGENDAWADKILAGLDTSEMTVIRLLDLVEPMYEEITGSMQSDEEEEDGEEYDEHVWTSPVNAAALVSGIADRFIELDGANAEKYRANADGYIAEINEIDAALREVVSNAARDTLVFGDRFPFLYLVREYGLKYDAAYPGCSSDTDVSAATIASLIEYIKTENIDTVLYIELSSHRVADILCEATGAHSMMLHSCHNVTADEFDAGATYVSLMNANITVLEEALG